MADSGEIGEGLGGGTPTIPNNPSVPATEPETVVISDEALMPKEEDELDINKPEEDESEEGEDENEDNKDFELGDDEVLTDTVTATYMPQTGVSDSRAILSAMLAVALASTAVTGALIKREGRRARLIRNSNK